MPGRVATDERTVEQRVTDWAFTQSILVLKFTPQGQRGWPDRMFVLPNGTICFIEFKRENKKPRKLQWARIAMLHAYQVPAEYFDDADKAISWLGSHLDTPAIPNQGYPQISRGALRRLIHGSGVGKDEQCP